LSYILAARTAGIDRSEQIASLSSYVLVDCRVLSA